MTNEQKSKNVRLDNDVITTLASVRRGFETPNDCLKRLLSCDCVQKEINKSQSEQEAKQEEDGDEK